MAEQDLDRNESATPYKLQKAREKGQTPKSMDVTAAAVFLAAMAYFSWQGWALILDEFRVAYGALVAASAAVQGGPPLLTSVARHMLIQAGILLVPFFLLLMFAAVIATATQIGGVLSWEPLKIDFDRINPMTGLRRIFSLRTLFDAARACVKLLVLAIVAMFALKSLLPQFYAIASQSPYSFLRTMIEDIERLGLRLAVALGVIAAVDLLFTRREFSKKMRMSKRELKDEHKNREGDPRIRARLRELRKEALKRSLATRNTRNADFLLANPTHFAVAFKYVHGEMESPRLIAKGTDRIAAKMRAVAARHRIPVVRNPSLARQLFKEVEVDESVPPRYYADLAKIVVWILALKGSGARGMA